MAKKIIEENKVPTKEEILEVYSTRLSSEGSVRQQLLHRATDFLDYADGNYDRETLNKYFDHLKTRHNYGDGSLNHAFGVLRTVFMRNKMDWPFNRGDAPIIRESEINAPALNPITIRRMIEAVKRSQNFDAKALLAVSTTYGLRRQELMNLTGDNVNIGDKTLFVATLKHGREKTHLIPNEIVPYIRPYDFDVFRSEFFMAQLWYEMEYMIKLKHIDRVGFHSIRRTLDTLLLHNFKETEVSSFLRWKQATSNNMAFRYSKTKFVGEEEETTEINSDSLTLDQRIFGKDENGNYSHPFLGSWV
ncbi:MAG: tyrosine-type recombinase/integrase [Chloroflexota bacterium]